MTLFERINKTIDGLGQVDLSGIQLEQADGKLLDPSTLDLDRHVSIQPSAIAYYGAMRKEAGRKLMQVKREYDRWEKKKYALAKVAESTGTKSQWKPTTADIEARYVIDNEKEIEIWEEKLERATEEDDVLDSWYKAWLQKSFSLKEHAGIAQDEWFNSKDTMSESDTSLSKIKLREVQRVLDKRRSQLPATLKGSGL